MNWKVIRAWLAVLCLLALSVAGFWGVASQWSISRSFGEIFSTAVQSVYALLGLVAIVGLRRRMRWARGVLWVWLLALVLTGATGPVVWGGQGWGAGAMAAVLTGAIASIVMALSWEKPKR